MNDAQLVKHLNDEAQRKLAATRGSGCVRKRRNDKRESALKFWFAQIVAGRDVWNHIAMIHKKAPKLTARVAGQFGVTDLGKLECNGG